MPRLIALLVACAISLTLNAPSQASSWLVQPDGFGDVADIQTAVSTAAEADTIVLDDGTFTEQSNCEVDFGAKNLVVTPESGASPVIDGQRTWRGFIYAGGQSSQSVLIGVEFREVADFSGNGGAIRCANGSSPTIASCLFTNCRGVNGGAISAEHGSGPLITGNTFDGNSTTQLGEGGAIFCDDAPATVIMNTTFHDNSALEGGAMACKNGSHVEVTDCIFADNTASRGGAMVAKDSGPVVALSTFYGNEGTSQGGAIAADNLSTPSLLVTESTFNANASTAGGTIHFDQHAGTVDRCIIGHDTRGSPIGCWATAIPTVTCTITWNNFAGDEVCGTNGGDNLIADPEFCGVPGSHDYHLHASSPGMPSNNACMQRIGAHDEGCTTQIDATTWGRIKTRYR